MHKEVGKNRLILILLFTITAAAPGFSLEETLKFGAEDAWRDLAVYRGITNREGFRGFFDLVLSDKEYVYDYSTELLIHFNGAPEDYGKYRLERGSLETTGRVANRGGGSGAFDGRKDVLVLAPRRDAQFTSGNPLSDFTIEFWLFPLALSEGETVFLLTGKRRQGDSIMTQEIRCSLKRQRMELRLENIFFSPEGKTKTFVLTGNRILIPRQWNHYALRFDSSTGLLEFLINGITESITYASESGREEASSFLPVLGSEAPPELKIGEGYTGFMDELRVSSVFRDDFYLDRFDPRGGTVISRIIDLGQTDTRLLGVKPREEVPGNTAVYYYVRLSNEKTHPFDLPGQWIPLGSVLLTQEPLRGRYLQFRADLFPDGTRSVTPRLSEIDIVFERDFPPLPPAGLQAEAGNGRVTLTWRTLPEAKVEGYLLYYGDRPGVYFGTDAKEGVSPIDVGRVTSITLTGLENGKLYFFTLVAYDSAVPRRTSAFSRELSARPIPW